MKNICRTVIISIFLIAALPSRAQNWTAFNTNNSELGNTIMAMTCDKKGQKWFGTDLGLARLVGKSWTDFSMFNEKLKGQYVNCLTVDKNNVIWIGTDDYGVIEFDGTHWTEYKEQMRSLQMKFISEIAIDRNDVKWIGVTLGGLVRFDGHEWSKFTAETSGLLSDFILCVAIDRTNRKWIGTNEGISIYNDSRWMSYTPQNSPLPDKIVPAILIDKDNVKWIASLGGLVRFDGENWVTYNTSNSPLPCNAINGMAFDANGTLWMVTDKGVAAFDGKSTWCIYTPEKVKLPKDVLRRIMIDNQGNKWFGSSLQGVVRFSAHPIKGRVVDEKGNPIANISIKCGEKIVTTDEHGEYYGEVACNGTIVISPESDGRTFEPASRKLTAVNGAMLHEDFVCSSNIVAQGNSTERISITPYLEQGYITISLESAQAEVEFVNAQGESIRTIPQYKNGAKITISRMPKSNYTLYIRTVKGEKSVQFNLK